MAMINRDIAITAFVIGLIVNLPVIFILMATTDNKYVYFIVAYATAVFVDFIVNAIKYPWEK